MGYYTTGTSVSPGVGNGKTRVEVFPAAERPILPLSAHERPVRQGFRGVGSTMCTVGVRYYGYRYYNPKIGRWVNRDPIEEAGGVNVYGFVGNGPIVYFDKLGLVSKKCCEDEVVGAINTDPNLLQLYHDLRNSHVENIASNPKCLRGGNDSIICRKCGPTLCGTSSAGCFRVAQRQIVICIYSADNNPGASDVTRTLYHEFQHAAEYCRGNPYSDCNGRLCFEARACFCSGEPESQARSLAGNSAVGTATCSGVAPSTLQQYLAGCVLNSEVCHIQRPPNSDNEVGL